MSDQEAAQQGETESHCPTCGGREWQPAHVTLSADGRVLGLAYPLTCVGCGLVRTMPVSHRAATSPLQIVEPPVQSLRERVERAQRLIGRTAVRAVADDGLGVIWECDNCHAITETGLDDVPSGWLNEEVDEDDYPEDEEVPWELILCDQCRAPDRLSSHGTSSGEGPS